MSEVKTATSPYGGGGGSGIGANGSHSMPVSSNSISAATVGQGGSGDSTSGYIEIMEGRVYVAVLQQDPIDDIERHYFSIDAILTYQPFYRDFGPLNLGCTYRFCHILNQKLQSVKLAGKKIIYYCADTPQFIANAATLIGIYQVAYMGRTPAQAASKIQPLGPFLPFADASVYGTTFKLHPTHCIYAFHKAMQQGIIDFATFNVDEYEYYECVENGDLNVILPGKFLAFSSPHAKHISPDGYPALTPADYIPVFKKLGVTGIVRLNDRTYDRRKFVSAGFAHHDLFFEDGSNPPAAILVKFLTLVEAVKDSFFAVHCKAGLGRTGSLIGAYMMKHHGFTAHEIIAWLRLCRPGSVIGQQQHYLVSIEARMHADGARLHHSNSSSNISSSSGSHSRGGSISSPSGVGGVALRSASPRYSIGATAPSASTASAMTSTPASSSTSYVAAAAALSASRAGTSSTSSSSSPPTAADCALTDLTYSINRMALANNSNASTSTSTSTSSGVSISNTAVANGVGSARLSLAPAPIVTPIPISSVSPAASSSSSSSSALRSSSPGSTRVGVASTAGAGAYSPRRSVGTTSRRSIGAVSPSSSSSSSSSSASMSPARSASSVRSRTTAASTSSSSTSTSTSTSPRSRAATSPSAAVRSSSRVTVRAGAAALQSGSRLSPSRTGAGAVNGVNGSVGGGGSAPSFTRRPPVQSPRPGVPLR